MADSIRGDGLLRADSALAALLDDPQRLDRARSRFSNSPPSYRSHQSGTPTRSASPDPLNDEELRREEHKFRLEQEYCSSYPYDQFKAHTREEREQIREGLKNGTRRVPIGIDFVTLSKEIVKKRWIEQGIWNEDWSDAHPWRWRHEEPLKPGSESRSESEAEAEAKASNPFSIFSTKSAEREERRPRTNQETRRTEERRAVREHEREASRPLHQFVYQILKEGERIRDESSSGNGAVVPDPADINTRTYNTVKSTWIKRGIWNRKWGILPGMSWKHEQPLKDMLDEEMRDYDIARAQEPPLEADELAGAAPAPPGRNPFASSPPDERPHEPNQPEINIPNEPLQDPADDALHLAPLPNDNAEEEELAPRRPAVQKRRRGKKQLPSQEVEEGARPGDTAPLMPVHASRVSKAAPKKKGTSSQQRMNVSEPSIPDLPTTQPAPVTPRRSKRLQEAESATKADVHTPVVPEGLSNDGAPQSKRRRTAAGKTSTSASRPSGISKRQQRPKRNKAR